MFGRQSDAEGVIDLGRVRGAHTPCPINTAYAHWMDIKGARLMPLRTDIQPAVLQPTLSQSFILERISKGQARFRVVGSAVSELVGHDVRSMPLSVLFDAHDRRKLQEAVTSVLEEPAEIRLSLAATSNGADLVSEMILLPLRSDLGDVTRILGAVRQPGFHLTGPVRFQITDVRHKTLIGYADATAHATSPAATPAQPVKKPRPTVERGHLQLVASSED